MRSKPAFASYFLILLCSVPRYARCQAIDGVYRGTLGRQEIVVEIGVDPEQADGAHLIGRYFYRRPGVGISLKGARPGRQLSAG
ncbi:MAG TPA: hypothetical protein VFR24_15050 [Candidatus Angelobacter sp.]|nr:hypothetical protein [Candidatus Angelobacter sp.]